jgi:hypothetical protein
MTPSQLSARLRRIAASIDASESPDRGLVVAALKGLLAARPPVRTPLVVKNAWMNPVGGAAFLETNKGSFWSTGDDLTPTHETVNKATWKEIPGPSFNLSQGGLLSNGVKVKFVRALSWGRDR